VNLITGESYIGQTIKGILRWKEHKNAAKKGMPFDLYYAMKKYGIENFKFEIIKYCYDVTTLNFWEEYYIKLYDSFRNGYNMTLGGGCLLASCLVKGTYFTPFGIFPDGISSDMMYNLDDVPVRGRTLRYWCKNSNKIIVARHHKYFSYEDVGKTYREIGFYFEPNSKYEWDQDLEDIQKTIKIYEWITPKGTFPSSKAAAQVNNMSTYSIYNFCKNPDRIIKSPTLKFGKIYEKKVKEGMTYGEFGFGFNVKFVESATATTWGA
jgi:hypothetical protein